MARSFAARWFEFSRFSILASLVTVICAAQTAAQESYDTLPTDDEYGLTPVDKAEAPAPAQEDVVSDDAYSDDAASDESYSAGTYASPAPLATAKADRRTPVVESGTKTETIKERYPSGKVKIERVVSQDSEGNFVNHGSWTMWDENGRTLAEGDFRNNRRQGVWTRFHSPNDSNLFSENPFDQFSGGFISKASFENGKLHGTWTISDAKGRKVIDWEFADGVRNGNSVWFFATGRPFREIAYHNGAIDGELVQYNAEGKVVRRDTYQEGRKIAAKRSFHSSEQKKSEGIYLHAAVVLKTADDWWNARPATFTTSGRDVRHGAWKSWFTNGQVNVEGEYRNDVPVGQFVWWYSNGQVAMQGSYEAGKQVGPWVRWHPNGIKSTQGHYRAGHPTGPWTWWHATGKVKQSADFSQPVAGVDSTNR